LDFLKVFSFFFIAALGGIILNIWTSDDQGYMLEHVTEENNIARHDRKRAMSHKEGKVETRVNLSAGAVGFIEGKVSEVTARGRVREAYREELFRYFEEGLVDLTGEDAIKAEEELIKGLGNKRTAKKVLKHARCRSRCRCWKVSAAFFKVLFVLILLISCYTIWFVGGKRVLKTDYLELLNEENRPAELVGTNGWDHYSRSFDLFIEPNETILRIIFPQSGRGPKRYEDLSRRDIAAIEKWILEMEDSWNEFVAGSGKDYSYHAYRYSQGEIDKCLYNIDFSDYRYFSFLAKFGIWRGRINLASGRVAESLKDYVAVIRGGSHLNKNELLKFLKATGLSISIEGYEDILKAIDSEKLSADDMKYLSHGLVDIYSEGYPEVSMWEDRINFLDAAQRRFTEGFPGGGHLIPRYSRAYMGEIYRFLTSYGRLYFWSNFPAVQWVSCMLHAGRDETISKAEEAFIELEELARLRPYDIHQRGLDLESIKEELSLRKYFMIRYYLHNMEEILIMHYEGLLFHEAVLTVLSLEIRKAERGGYPAELKDLVEEGYLKELPMDPYSDGALKYIRGDDKYALYSVSLDFEDDGGKIAWDNMGRFRRWDFGGDAVFWPLVKASRRETGPR
jgi:hypothetical protein